MTQHLPLLVGIAGFARAGKSSIAKVLESECGFIEHSFASAIRRFTIQLVTEVNPEFDLERDKTVPQHALSGRTPRSFMQLLGTEFGRNLVHPGFWVNHTMMKVRRARDAGFPVVISDVRFKDEAEAIRAMGGVVLWVHRPGIEAGEHASEQGFPAHLVDLTIHNDSTLGQLRKGTKNLHHDLVTWKSLYADCDPAQPPVQLPLNLPSPATGD